MAVLVIASVVPGETQPGDSVYVWMLAATPTLLQKILHVFVYAFLTLLWAWTLAGLEWMFLRLSSAVTLAVTFGALMEWLQTQVPGRFGTLYDVMLNAVGAMIGLLAAIFLL